jgi:hypothetical protein
LSDGQVYDWQVRAWDTIDRGGFSGTCTFGVDVTPPQPSAGVTSADYPADGSFHGGAGISGSFTLAAPNTSPLDVLGYAYTLDSGIQASQATQITVAAGQPVTVDVTPRKDGVQKLTVWTKDRAANYSTAVTYTFSVRAGSGPDARWTFDEGSGSTAADGTGHGNDLTLDDTGEWAAGRGSGSALKPGSATAAATIGPLATVDTSGSPATVRTDDNFTVSALVKLSATGGTTQQTIVSQDGVETSAYALSYSAPDNRWRFMMAATDTAAPALATVLSNAAPSTGVWTYLVGTYDSTTHQVHLYVNEVAQTSVATLSGGFNATGAVAVGRRKWAGAATDYFTGSIDEARVYARLVDPSEPEFTSMMNPVKPTITVPAGSPSVGQAMNVTFTADGDPTVTTVKYSVNNQTLNLTAILSPAGGSVTVPITPTSAGDTSIVAVAVDTSDRKSDLASVFVTVLDAPQVTGTVYLDATTDNPAGAGLPVTLLQGTTTVASTTTAANGTYSFTTGLVNGSTYTVQTYQGSACGLVAGSDVEVFGQTAVDLNLHTATDSFGYTCAAGSSSFVSASTVLALTGDDNMLQISLPFTMSYYGHPYTSAWVTTNGSVHFANPGSGSAYFRTSIPSDDAPNSVLAPFWDDLMIDASSSVRTSTLGTSPNRQFVIEWRNATFYNGTTNRINFETIMYENGDVRFNYSGLDNTIEQGTQAVVGMEDPTGTIGNQYSYREPTLTSGLSLLFTYPDVPLPTAIYALSGKVTRSGAGVANVPVTLGPDGLSTLTAADGSYTFANLAPDYYDLSVVGCETAGQSSIDLTGGDVTVDLPLTTVRDGGNYRCYATPSSTFYTGSTVLTAVTGDEAVASVALPFAFSFYGNTYSTVWISTNGFLSFADPGGTHSSDRTSLPNTDGPNLALYPYWDDLVVDSSASVRTVTSGTAPNRIYTVEWHNVTFYRDSTARFNVSVRLSETTGLITFWYQGLDTTAEKGEQATVGIENATGTAGSFYSVNTPILQNGSLTFTTS